MVQYYEIRAKIAQRIKDHLAEREHAVKEGQDPPSFREFQKNLICEYGVTTNTIRELVETIADGATVVDGLIARK